MPYLQLRDKRFPLRAASTRVGTAPDADVRVPSTEETAGASVTAIVDVTSDGRATIRCPTPGAEMPLRVNGVVLGTEAVPLIHGDKIEIRGTELSFGDDRRGGSTQAIPVLDLESVRRVRSPALAAAAGAVTGGRIVSLVDGREFVIPADGLTIGRDAECDVVLPSADVSRHHAELRREGATYVVFDTSTNGLFVNGERIDGSRALRRGDIFRLGSEEFRFHADPALVVPPVAPPVAAAVTAPVPVPPAPSAPSAPPPAPPFAPRAAPPSLPSRPSTPSPPALAVVAPPPAPIAVPLTPAADVAPPPVIPVAAPPVPAPPALAVPEPAPVPVAAAAAAPVVAPAVAAAPAEEQPVPVVAQPLSRGEPTTDQVGEQVTGARVVLATLEIVAGGPSAMHGRQFPVTAAFVSLGRGQDSAIVLPDETVSSAHATLRRRDRLWYITDAGSRNGTYVNGRRIQGETRLGQVAEVRLGGVKLAFAAVAVEPITAPVQRGGGGGIVTPMRIGVVVLVALAVVLFFLLRGGGR